MKTTIWCGLGVFLAVLLVTPVSECGSAEKSGGLGVVPMVSGEELKSRLNEAPLVVIDVRQGRDWEGSSEKIAGAVHEEPERIAEWAPKYSKDDTLVLYCA